MDSEPSPAPSPETSRATSPGAGPEPRPTTGTGAGPDRTERAPTELGDAPAPALGGGDSAQAPRTSPRPAGPSGSRDDVVALLRAVEQIGQSHDVRDLHQRGLAVTCRLVGASTGVLAIHDEQRPGRPAHAVTHGISSTDPRLSVLLEDEGERSGDDRVLRGRVMVGGQWYATLLVSGLTHQPASRDRVLVEAMATALGSHLDTLRQRRVSELHESVTRTVWELNRTLVDEVDLEVTLPLLTDRVAELTGARAVALVGSRSHGGLRVLAASGDDVGSAVSELAPDLTEVLASGVAQHWQHGEGTGAQHGTEVTSLVPLDTQDDGACVLAVHGWRPFPGVTQRQVRDVLSALALHASLILDRERGEREHDLLTVLEDRDRIARDLHDLVIQRLFAVGLTLQGASRKAPEGEVVERLEGAVAELDQTIRDIRATIFELRHRPGEGSFRADLRQLVESYAPTLGFAPVVHLVGPLDAVADDEVHTQVLMVVREALSNVARHAHASSVVVQAEATAQTLSVVVRDDGVGLSSQAVESGLGNVRARAAERGGAVELTPVEPHGTQLRWSVPV